MNLTIEKKHPTVSIITATYNSAATIRSTLESIKKQTYPYIEHIIVDGKSTDETVSIAKQYSSVSKIISEPDNGIYDAMNKGILAATGDVIGILNSDDFYSNTEVLANVMNAFIADPKAVIGDIIFVKPENLDKVVRRYSAKKWHPGKFKWGFMPPHAGVFLPKDAYRMYGLYQTDYKIAADYELLIRMFYTNNLPYKYISKTIVTMRTGGISTRNAMSRYILNKEIVRGCSENNISTNLFKLSLKYPNKVFEYLQPWFASNDSY